MVTVYVALGLVVVLVFLPLLVYLLGWMGKNLAGAGKFSWKIPTGVVWAIALVLVVIFFQDIMSWYEKRSLINRVGEEKAEEVVRKRQEEAFQQEMNPPKRVVEQTLERQTGPRISYGEAVWKTRAADGSIPVGEWSEWILIKPDCNLRYTLGDFAILEGKDAFGNITQVTKGSNPMNIKESRIKVLRLGMTQFQYKEVCS